MTVLNLNVGLLGHVDSGKTSIAKSLSMTSSTACFDKNPQSKERGITIDLGFSSFITPFPKHLKGEWKSLQFTIVDCPGHASLIRTIIGGAQTIDIMVLVIDITKGVQTQTAECLVLGEIIKKPLIVVLNKIDILDRRKRSEIIEKTKKKMALTLSKTIFVEAPIIPLAANPGGQEVSNEAPMGLLELIDTMKAVAYIPERYPGKPMVFSVDHCFSIKGKGTVLTGKILQGTIKVNDTIEIPSLQVGKKVKSIQIFRNNVNEATHGDRVGVCVTQFDPKLLERGVVSCPGYLSSLYAVIIDITKVQYYKYKISTDQKYHVTVGYDTVLGKVSLFSKNLKTSEDSPIFDINEEYKYETDIEGEEGEKENKKMFALLEFEKPVIASLGSLMIASKLDLDVHTSTCRIAFYGVTVLSISDRNYQQNFLPTLKIYKIKERSGVIQRMVNENEVIVQSIFKKETKMQMFSNLKVTLTNGETGTIEGAFGQSGKVKVRIPEGLKPETKEFLLRKREKCPSVISNDVLKITLKFKKFVYDKEKHIVQD